MNVFSIPSIYVYLYLVYMFIFRLLCRYVYLDDISVSFFFSVPTRLFGHCDELESFRFIVSFKSYSSHKLD